MTAENSPIGADEVRKLEHASRTLISRIREAVQAFYAAPPQDWRQWEEYRTPSPWEDIALANLERYHRDLEHAIQSYATGDIEPIVDMAASYTGLSKDLDFDMRWMTPAHHDAIKSAAREIVTVADRIRRAGYEALSA